MGTKYILELKDVLHAWSFSVPVIDLNWDERLTIPGINGETVGLEGRYHGQAIGTQVVCPVAKELRKDAIVVARLKARRLMLKRVIRFVDSWRC